MSEDCTLPVFALVKYTNIGGTESVIKIMLEACFGQKKAKSDNSRHKTMQLASLLVITH